MADIVANHAVGLWQLAVLHLMPDPGPRRPADRAPPRRGPARDRRPRGAGRRPGRPPRAPRRDAARRARASSGSPTSRSAGGGDVAGRRMTLPHRAVRADRRHPDRGARRRRRLDRLAVRPTVRLRRVLRRAPGRRAERALAASAPRRAGARPAGSTATARSCSRPSSTRPRARSASSTACRSATAPSTSCASSRASAARCR